MNFAADQALKLLQTIHERRTAYAKAMEPINQLSSWQHDFPIHISAIDEQIEKSVMNFIKTVLGSDMGEYWLYEASKMEFGGCCAVLDGLKQKSWPIKTIDDVRVYLREAEGVDV